MRNDPIDMVKSSGEKVRFSLEKLRASFKHTGANDNIIHKVSDDVSRESLLQISITRLLRY